MREKIIEKISEIISTIEMERENLSNSKFDEGFDCGTQLTLDLLEEWKEQLEGDKIDENRS